MISVDEPWMYAYVNVARVRSPTAICSPAAMKQSQILIIWFQCFWSVSLPYANVQSAGKQAPILSASCFNSTALWKLLILPSCSSSANGTCKSNCSCTAPSKSRKTSLHLNFNQNVLRWLEESLVLPLVGWSEATIKTKQQAPFVTVIQRSHFKATHICQTRKHLGAVVNCLNIPILKFDHLHKRKNRITSFHWLQVITFL